MAITTAESFLSLLEKSKLLGAQQLAQAHEAAQQADGAKALAKSLVRAKLLTRWQAGQLLAGRSTFLLGKYKLIDLLGSGGIGRVFLAEHTTMSRPVVLKIISKQLGRDPASLEQFLTEARAIAALDHPNIVHAYNVDNEGDRYYMVMEFVEGRDLEGIVEAEGPLGFDRAAGYIQQAADGLAHAHAHNMIHCDIKPANLLVNKQDVVKILDMGMARLIGRGKGGAAEKDERLLGTVDYLAPEQATESPDLDHRADIYSLGCTFYFLLTGRPPFPEGTLHERMLKHQTDQPRKIAELRPDVPEELVGICAKMMAKSPDERFQSAEEVSQTLSEWCPAEAVLEPAEPPAEAELPAAVAAIQVDGVTGPELARRRGAPSLVSRLTSQIAAAFQQRPRTFLLAGLGGGLAALAVLVGLIAFFVVSGGRPDGGGGAQVASEGAQTERQESSEAGEPDEDGWRVMPAGRDFDPEAFQDEPADKSGKSAESEKPQQPESAKAAPAEAKLREPEPEKPKPDEQGSQPVAEPAPGESTPGQEASAEKPQSEKPEPEQKEPEKKEPEKEEPEKKEPDKEKHEKPEPENPQRENPLQELAEAVDLPEASAGSGGQASEPFTIGKIHSGPGVGWQLYLLGGDTAQRGSRKFVLEQKEKDPAKATWLVQLETASSSSDAAREDMARIWRDNNALQFQWAQKAPSSANYLRNCILQVRVEGESKFVALAAPKQVEPIDIDLERGTVNATVPVKWLPSGGGLRVEITKVEGREGHAVEPSEPAEPKAPLELSFPRTDRHGNTADRVAFRLNFTQRPAAMTVKLQLLEPPSTVFRSLKGVAEIRRNQLEIMRDEVQKALNPKDKDKAPKGQERSNLIRQLDAIEQELWYINFYTDVQGKAKIHLRLFNEVDGRQVVLASTQDTSAVAQK